MANIEKNYSKFLNVSLKVNDLATATSDNVGERTTNAEGVFSLCAGDRLLVIVSWSYYPSFVSSRLILIRLHQISYHWRLKRSGCNQLTKDLIYGVSQD